MHLLKCDRHFGSWLNKAKQDSVILKEPVGEVLTMKHTL